MNRMLFVIQRIPVTEGITPYTRWSIDRGGLFHINDNTFILFEAIELKTQILPESPSGSTHKIVKDTIVDSIVWDEIV